jgi:hypothetical protein
MKLPEETKLRLVRNCLDAWRAGYSWEQVERRFKTTRRTITTIAKELGIPLRKENEV